MSRSRNPPQKGQGAARAKQMGLLLDLAPDGGLDDSGGNEEELEAELLALMGGGGRGGPAGRKHSRVTFTQPPASHEAVLLFQVLDGRKATGGKLEVRVKIREPLGGVQLQSVTEKWLVIDPLTPSPEKERKQDKNKEKERQAPSPRSKPQNDHDRNFKPSSSPPQYKMHSFSLLHYDKERLEWKISEYKKNRRDPSELIKQHMDVCHRLQWQKSYLEKHPAALTEYENVLRKFVHGLSDSVKTFSSQDKRDAAKDALGRLKMVENELESVRKKRAVRE